MLRGHTYVHEATADPVIEHFLRAYLAEARVTLAPLPGVDLDEYIESLFIRFANAAIADTLARLAVDASDRIPKFVLPTIRDNLVAERSVTMGATMIATWSRWLVKMVDEGRAAEIKDPLKDQLLRQVHGDDPSRFIAMRNVFGSLSANTGFQREYAAVALDLERIISAL
jgi:mannitol 2-dehydrogenase